MICLVVAFSDLRKDVNPAMCLFMGHVAHESRFDGFNGSLGIGRLHDVVSHEESHPFFLKQSFDVSIDKFRALITS